MNICSDKIDRSIEQFRRIDSTPKSTSDTILEQVKSARVIARKYQEERAMTSLRTLMFSGVVAILSVAPAAASMTVTGSTDVRPAKSIAMQYAKVVCMTDEGGGRYKPCDSPYKAANPGWRGMDTCMTDEGGGRYKPCDSGYKAKHMKK
jgi:hypothetical protein